MVGYLLGGLVFGTLSDKIGRKPTFLIANFFLLLAGLGGAMAPNYEFFLVSRFIVGFSIAGVEAACFVMALELVGPSKRTLAGRDFLTLAFFLVYQIWCCQVTFFLIG